MIDSVLAMVAEHGAWFVGGSLLSMLVGIFAVPALILRIPAEYFTHSRRRTLAATRRHPALRFVLNGAKNLVGAVFIAAGLVLLFLPGQGLLTLLVGLIIMNYPGKFAFERWLVRRPHVLPALNWLRTKYGRVPLLPPDGPD